MPAADKATPTTPLERRKAVLFYYKRINGWHQDWIDGSDKVPPGVIDEDVAAIAALLAAHRAEVAADAAAQLTIADRVAREAAQARADAAELRLAELGADGPDWLTPTERRLVEAAQGKAIGLQCRLNRTIELQSRTAHELAEAGDTIATLRAEVARAVATRNVLAEAARDLIVSGARDGRAYPHLANVLGEVDGEA